MSRPAPLRHARRRLLGGFVMDPAVAATWASGLINTSLDPVANFPTICETILDRVHQYHATFDFVGEFLQEAKYIVITRSAKFSGYRGMDPLDIPKYEEGDKEAKIRMFLKAEGVFRFTLGFQSHI
jgi:hypothetical protein